jgi:hypothetical protein
MTDVVIGWEDNKPENYFRQITYWHLKIKPTPYSQHIFNFKIPV